MLPGGDSARGPARDARRRQTTDVLVLTAAGASPTGPGRLDLGADDYVTKPFGLRELLARVRNRLRRRAGPGDAERTIERFKLGDAEIDLAAFQIRRDGQSLPLSPKEAEHPDAALPARRQGGEPPCFLDEVWGTDQFVSTRTVDMHLLNLRQKLEPDPKNPRYLLTVHGVGYG